MDRKGFIIWFKYDGEEEYAILIATDEDEAIRKFNTCNSSSIDEIREIKDDNFYLSFV